MTGVRHAPGRLIPAIKSHSWRPASEHPNCPMRVMHQFLRQGASMLNFSKSAAISAPAPKMVFRLAQRCRAVAGMRSPAPRGTTRRRALAPLAIGATDKKRSDPLQRVCVSRGATSRASTSITSLCLARGRDIVPAPRRPKCTTRARRALRSFHASKMKPRTAPNSKALSSSTRPATAAKTARIPVKAAPVMPFEGPLIRSRLMVSIWLDRPSVIR